MKNLLLLLALSLSLTSRVAAQSIRFERDSLRQVFGRGRQQNKPVFVLVAAPPTAADLPVALRNQYQRSGLSAPAVVAQLNRDFLNKEVTFGTAEARAVAQGYDVTSYPTYLYFSPAGNLVYRRAGNASAEERYRQDLAAARQALADPRNLDFYETDFARGNRTLDVLREHIRLRQRLGLPIAPALLDAYAGQLPAQALYRGPEVLFILEGGPVVGSQAFQLSHLSQRLIDSLYRALPLAKATALNNRIIRNTLARAIATNSRELALKGAGFARGTWSGDYRKGAQTYERNLLNFYQATKDTASYLRQAIPFYEQHYLNIAPDSAAKAVAALRAFRQRQAQQRQQLAANLAQPRPAAPTMTTATAVVAVGMPPAGFLQELNNGAWSIYQTGTRNQTYLWHATLWAKRAVALDPAPYNHDTLAHLLYRLGFHHEAEATQQQAVALARQAKSQAAMYERELEKMKKQTL